MTQGIRGRSRWEGGGGGLTSLTLQQELRGGGGGGEGPHKSALVSTIAFNKTGSIQAKAINSTLTTSFVLCLVLKLRPEPIEVAGFVTLTKSESSFTRS